MCRCCRTGFGRRCMSGDKVSLQARSERFGQAEGEGIIRCDACPVLCRVRPGRSGACSRYANEGGQLVRTDPAVALARTVEAGGPVVAFADGAWDGKILDPARAF